MHPHRPLLRTLWRTGILGRCPECAETSIFSGLVSMHERCAVCALRYQAAQGAWIGALAIAYTYGAVAAILLALADLRYEFIADTGLDPMWTVVAFSQVVTLLTYRWAKSVWFSLLYVWDFMAFGDEPPGPPPVNPGKGMPPVGPDVRR